VSGTVPGRILLGILYTKDHWRHTGCICSVPPGGGDHACQLVQNSNNPIKVNRFGRSGNIARLLRNTQVGETTIIMTCLRVKAASEAKVKGLLGTKIYASRLGFFLHPLLITVMSHMFLERKTIELWGSLFPKLYRSGRFRVRSAENTPHFNQPLKSYLSTRELTGLTFIYCVKYELMIAWCSPADGTYGSACFILVLLSFTRVRKITKSDNQLRHVCPSVRPLTWKNWAITGRVFV
jgi:hypothetical protein